MESNPSSTGKTAEVVILIPTFGAADKLRICLLSLSRYLNPHTSVIVLDDATPDASVADVAAQYFAEIPFLRYVKNDNNLGFVRTCNRGISEFTTSVNDVLLLNSDTEVTSGFLEELQTVLWINDRHAVVCPRSDNATIFSVPFAKRVSPSESHETWLGIRDRLPRFQIMPTAVGFCMLVRRSLFQRFGMFDEAYGQGYNEENDFVCRMNRYGYSAVAANYAFVYHHSESSFGDRRGALEKKNNKLLTSRYPEYNRLVNEWVQHTIDPIEYYAHLDLAHRPRILFDLHHLEAKHCGTSQFGIQLLHHLRHLLEPDIDLYVAINDQAFRFFASQITGYRFYDPRDDGVLDLIFKPCQIFSWQDFDRMNRAAPRLCFTLQDMIGTRCNYLSDASRYHLSRETVRLADAVIAISDSVRSDYNAYYGAQARMTTIHHGSDPACLKREEGSYILVVGNDFTHKAVEPAVAALIGAGPIHVLGCDLPEFRDQPNVVTLPSGNLSRSDLLQLYLGARVVVYPSQYEGFGLPVFEAINCGKRVVAFDTAPMREVATLVPDSWLTLVDTFKEMKTAVETVGNMLAGAPQINRTWNAVAKDNSNLLRAALAQPINDVAVRERWRVLRTLLSLGVLDTN